jgi:hypothetical protein
MKKPQIKEKKELHDYFFLEARFPIVEKSSENAKKFRALSNEDKK